MKEAGGDEGGSAQLWLARPPILPLLSYMWVAPRAYKRGAEGVTLTMRHGERNDEMLGFFGISAFFGRQPRRA